MHTQTSRILIACVSFACIVSQSSGASWLDDFDDGTLDTVNYTVHQHPSGGTVTVTEDDGGNPASPLGYLSIQTNSPGGSYALSGVQVDLGDTVRTEFMMASAWNNYSTTSIGLTYDLSADRYLDASVAAYFIQQWRDNVMAYRHVGMAEDSAVLTNVGDPEGQRWIYELQVGEDNGDGTFDVTFRVYDQNGAPLGATATFTTSTPTGDIYWYVGDNRTLDRVYRVQIGANLPPIGPATCAEAIASGYRLSADFNEDCYVNEGDIAVLVSAWTTCNDPVDPNCTPTW